MSESSDKLVSSRRSFLRSAVATAMLTPALAGAGLADETAHAREAAAGGADAMVLGRISLDRKIADQEGTLNGTLRFLRAVSGPVIVRWVDSFGRITGEQSVSPSTSSNVAASFSFNMRPGLTFVNWIRVTINGVPQAATASFMLSPTWTPWDDYHTISWATRYPDGYYDQLREAGLDAIIAYSQGDFTPVLDNNFRFYVEQMAPEIFAVYHKRTSEWRELLAKFSRNREDMKLWVRQPCVNDPKTDEYLRKYLTQYVRKYRAFRPLFYNIADELGQGDQIEPSDFCHSKFCVEKFAGYLRKEYGEPSGVAREWNVGHEMTHWDDTRLRAEPEWRHNQGSMIILTTTDRAFEAIALAGIIDKYKTIGEFNREWGTSFPVPRGNPTPPRGAWEPILAVARDTASVPNLDAASLEKAIGPLKRANARWGSLGWWSAPDKPTTFKSWDEVIAFLNRYYKELGEITSTRHWNVSPWCDFRNYMDATYADAIKRAGDICKAEDPHAVCGTEGAQVPSAYGWYNYEQVVRAIDAVEVYNRGNNVEVIRSLGPSIAMISTHRFSTWPGQSLTEDVRRAQRFAIRPVWWGLFHTHNGVLIWDNNEPENQFVNRSTGKLTRSAETFSPILHELRAGIGKLFIGVTPARKHDGIAIHYSQPSIQVHWLLSNLKHAREWMIKSTGRSEDFCAAVRNSWTKLIEDLGLQYNFVGSEAIKDGGLNSGEYKVFVMPESIAVSPEEAAQIRAFVRAGGTVVADCRVAELNGLGRDPGKGQLDDVFGIAHGPAQSAADSVEGVDSRGALNLKGQPLHGVRVGDPTVTLAGGAALAKSGNVPMVVVNRFGSGQAIFLNMEIADYGFLRLRPDSRSSLPEIAEGVFALGGVEPRVRVLGPDGKRLPGVEIVRFANGECEQVAIFRNPQYDNAGWDAYPKPAEKFKPVLNRKFAADVQDAIDNSLLETNAQITIEWPLNRETYDVRGRKNLGKLKTQKATLNWWEPLVFTRSDNPLPPLQVAVAPDAHRGEAVNVSLTNAGPLPTGTFRVVHLEFKMPSGEPYDLYARNLTAKDAVTVERIPFALNDPKGKWTLSAHDLITGELVEVSFNLA